MKYDDASWHYGGNYPTDLPEQAGATHIAMFVAWALHHGFAGEVHHEDFADELEALIARRLTPRAHFLLVCDEKFSDQDLNDEGNAFAQHYYQGDNSIYYQDLDALFSHLPSIYHMPDTWKTFETIRARIDKRFNAWSRQRK